MPRFSPHSVEDLKAHKGSSLVVAGEQQPAEVHAMVYAINDALGNTGKTVSYIEAVDVNAAKQREKFDELIADLEAEQVDALFIIGGNPVYNAPGGIDFGGLLEQVRFRLHVSSYLDETSHICNWHIPRSHYLEAWGDAEPLTVQHLLFSL